MERDQHAAAVEKVKIKLNRKANELTESWAREKALQSKVSQLQEQVRYTARWMRGMRRQRGNRMGCWRRMGAERIRSTCSK